VEESVKDFLVLLLSVEVDSALCFKKSVQVASTTKLSWFYLRPFQCKRLRDGVF
jgi:hypothetical protein